MVLLKYLSNFWRTLEMPLINYKINIFLTWSEKVIIVTGIMAIKNQNLKYLKTNFILHL